MERVLNTAYRDAHSSLSLERVRFLTAVSPNRGISGNSRDSLEFERVRNALCVLEQAEAKRRADDDQRRAADTLYRAAHPARLSFFTKLETRPFSFVSQSLRHAHTHTHTHTSLQVPISKSGARPRCVAPRSSGSCERPRSARDASATCAPPSPTARATGRRPGPDRATTSYSHPSRPRSAESRRRNTSLHLFIR